MSDKVEYAKKVFLDGYNCAQAVFTTFSEEYGLSKELAHRAAGGFGGGVRSGEICGAVSGAVLVIGLRYGKDKQTCNSKTVEFITAFRKKNKTVVCRDILDVDISTEEGMNSAKDKGLFKTTCVDMVADAVNILEELGY